MTRITRLRGALWRVYWRSYGERVGVGARGIVSGYNAEIVVVVVVVVAVMGAAVVVVVVMLGAQHQGTSLAIAMRGREDGGTREVKWEDYRWW